MFLARTLPSSTPIWSVKRASKTKIQSIIDVGCRRRKRDGPKELMPQMVPCVKILCSYIAMSEPGKGEGIPGSACDHEKEQESSGGRTKSGRGKLLEHDRVSGLVALKDLRFKERSV